MGNKLKLKDKIAYDEFLAIQHARHKTLRYQQVLIASVLGLIAILVVGYLSQVMYVQILLFYLAVVIVFLLLRNNLSLKDNEIYHNLLEDIRKRFKDN